MVNQFLDSVPDFRSAGKEAANFDLDRFRKFCEAIGNPQDKFNSIHVGGTNGKGSTCQILASIYREAGYNTGLYTSPHILRFSERFRYNEQEIPETDLVEFFRRFASMIRSFRLTYFEISTALAFWWFAEKNVDLAVVEVGLGGRLDATNVIIPVASVITNVSLDHTDILGDTIEKIAREKAGIIKPGVPVVLGNISSEAKGVVTEIAGILSSPVSDIDYLEPFFQDGKHILLHEGKQVRMETGLETPVQVYNVAAAWQTVHVLHPKFPVHQHEIINGVARVRARYPGPGRFERLLEGKRWYFDGGHNLEAVRAMKEKVKSIRPVSETVVVLSLMKDKLNERMINEFLDFKKIFYHSLETKRAATFEEFQQWLPDASPFPADGQSRDVFFKENESELVIFAGSFYFYSTVRDWLASFAICR